jgi:hypothetical protein
VPRLPRQVERAVLPGAGRADRPARAAVR